MDPYAVVVCDSHQRGHAVHVQKFGQFGELKEVLRARRSRIALRMRMPFADVLVPTFLGT